MKWAVHETPERLMNDQYMPSSSPYQLFMQTINDDVSTHWHEFYEISFVVSGSATHVLNGVPARIAKGSIFLMTPADFHEIIMDADGETLQLYDLIFTEQLIREPLMELLFDRISVKSHIFDTDEFTQIEAEFKRIWRETHDWQAGSEFIVQGCLERVLIDLSRACRPKQIQTPASGEQLVQSPIRKALIYIQHHFRDSIPLEEVARLCGLSANYFSECFHKQTGMTFQLYVQELRLQFAKSLLKATKLPITEVSFASGFNTLPHFERTFKKRFAATPRQFRQSI
ncbi:helix-turn-helix domain-containing protein [Paenibacillus solisilvae]|uniref:Helix-turn-helix domain-containing protein n=1 Tax=Paenibacillus solisilvae TaxID=2486751 RepID=A0ABW0VYC8_9BACL